MSPTLKRSAGVLLVVSLFVFVIYAFTPRTPVEQIQYKSYSGLNPTSVSLKFSPPVDDLKLIPVTTIESKFRTDELISIEGTLLPPSDGIKPVLVEFLENRGLAKPVIANSGVMFPKGDLAKFKFLINAPKQAGEYLLVVQWIGGQYVARAKVIVRAP